MIVKHYVVVPDDNDRAAFVLLVLLGLLAVAITYLWNVLVDWQSLRNPVMSWIAGFYYTLFAYPLETLWHNATSGLSYGQLVGQNPNYSLAMQFSRFIRPIVDTLILFLGYFMVFGVLLPKRLSQLILLGPLLLAIGLLMYKGAIWAAPYVF